MNVGVVDALSIHFAHKLQQSESTTVKKKCLFCCVLCCFDHRASQSLARQLARSSCFALLFVWYRTVHKVPRYVWYGTGTLIQYCVLYHLHTVDSTVGRLLPTVRLIRCPYHISVSGWLVCTVMVQVQHVLPVCDYCRQVHCRVFV